MNRTLSASMVCLLFLFFHCQHWEHKAANDVDTRQETQQPFSAWTLSPPGTVAVAAKKDVEQHLIPKKPGNKSRKLKKRSLWRRLKFWKKYKKQTSKAKFKRSGKWDPGLGLYLLSSLAVVLAGLFLLYLVLIIASVLAWNGLITLAVMTVILGLFATYLVLRKIWKKITGNEATKTPKDPKNAEDIEGSPVQPNTPPGEDIPRYQFLDLDNAEITLCIYNTPSGDTPVRVRLGEKELTNHFGVTSDPQCFELSISENVKNEIRFEAPGLDTGKKELLRIIVEDGDIAREIYVRKGGTLELSLNR